MARPAGPDPETAWFVKMLAGGLTTAWRRALLVAIGVLWLALGTVTIVLITRRDVDRPFVLALEIGQIICGPVRPRFPSDVPASPSGERAHRRSTGGVGVEDPPRIAALLDSSCPAGAAPPERVRGGYGRTQRGRMANLLTRSQVPRPRRLPDLMEEEPARAAEEEIRGNELHARGTRAPRAVWVSDRDCLETAANVLPRRKARARC